MKAPDATKTTPCDPETFTRLLAETGLPAERVAERLDLTDRALRYYKAGQRPIPFVVHYAIQALAAHARRRQNRSGPGRNHRDQRATDGRP